MAGNKSVVIAALIANGAIAVLKFVGYLLTLSPSMLSETYHSISDTGNQVFLLLGIRFSQKQATQSHPFGYGKAQFFYSFLVSVLLFGIAGWESLKHGYSKLGGHGGGHSGGGGTVDLILFQIDPSKIPIEPIWVNVGVLVGAILFESYAFRKALKELKSQIQEFGWTGIPQAFRRTSDVTTLTAFTEDAVALAGAAIALVGVLASHYLGNPMYDAVSAMLIGVLLMGFAVALAWENKRLIIGESMPRDVESELKSVIAGHHGIRHVDELRTMYIGPQEVLLAADVSFDPELDTVDIDTDIKELENKLRDADRRVRYLYIEPAR